MIPAPVCGVVAIDPNYCPECGAELVGREFDGRERGYCPDCERVRFRNAVPAAVAIVHGDGEVLLIEADTGWELPGGHPEYDEAPRAAAARELAEETGLAARHDDLSLATVADSEHRDRHYVMIAYAVDRAAVDGDLRPGEEASAVAFHPLGRVLDGSTGRGIDRRLVRSWSG